MVKSFRLNYAYWKNKFFTMFIIELNKLKSHCPNFPWDTLWLKRPPILFLLEEFQWNLAWSRAIVSTQSLRKFWYFLFQIPIQVIRGTTNLKKKHSSGFYTTQKLSWYSKCPIHTCNRELHLGKYTLCLQCYAVWSCTEDRQIGTRW